MKHLYFLIIFIFSSFFTVSGQQLSDGYKLEWGNFYNVEDNYEEIFTFINDSTQILSVKFQKKGVVFQEFDAQHLYQIKQNTDESMSKRYVPQALLKKQGKVYLFFTDQKNLLADWDLYISEVDLESLRLKEYKLLFSVAKGLKYAFKRPLFHPYLSQDKSKLLFCYRIKNSVNDQDEKVLAYVFDDNLNELTRGVLDFPYQRDEVEYLDIELANDGTIYGLIRAEEKYHFIKFMDGEVSLNLLESEELAYMNDVTLREDTTGNFMMIGYFGDHIEKRHSLAKIDNEVSAKGVYMAQITKEGKILDEKKVLFPKQLLYDVMPKRDSVEFIEKDYDLGIRNLVLKEVEPRKDGSWMLWGEVSYILSEYDMGRTRDILHLEDVVGMKINAAGEVLWAKNINKHHIGGADNTHSYQNIGALYTYYDKNKTHYFMMPDHIKNANIADNDRPDIHRGGAGGFISVYTINDITGEKEHYILFDLRNVAGNDLKQFHIDDVLIGKHLKFYFEAYIGNKRDMLYKLELDPEVIK
ncbi:hypothetical protein LVD15_03450 [Fulvivirga maritima]|uniref:hypothetical protein n=1 Tax=Fulvivirga maritima TaxID=2904247 RepID=UPI001F48E022|nr:hypothetical protein [Fulvivirga maritima]UII27501.1 hypothetical protein LVD15_03450 [Fulvivirga maritima]